MPAITRRTWANLRDEVIRRAQGIDATGFSARVEHYLWSAYLDLCLTLHQYELNKVDTSLALSTSTNSLALPSDCYMVVGVKLRSATSPFPLVSQPTYKAARLLLGEYRGETSTTLKNYTRFGASLYFDKIPTTALKVDLYYYRYPAAPDYSTSATPEFGVDIDEHLIQATLSLLFPALGRPDLAAPHLTNFRDWLTLQVRPAMAVETPASKQDRFETVGSHGGQQG